jgi:hypothetical protein
MDNIINNEYVLAFAFGTSIRAMCADLLGFVAFMDEVDAVLEHVQAFLKVYVVDVLLCCAVASRFMSNIALMQHRCSQYRSFDR